MQQYLITILFSFPLFILLVTAWLKHYWDIPPHPSTQFLGLLPHCLSIMSRAPAGATSQLLICICLEELLSTGHLALFNWRGSAVHTCSFWEPTALTSTQLGPRQLPSVGHRSTLGFQPSPSRATRQKLLRETSEYNITCVHFPALRCHIQFGSFTCTVTAIN